MALPKLSFTFSIGEISLGGTAIISRQQFAEGKFRSEEEVFNRLSDMLLPRKEKGKIG